MSLGLMLMLANNIRVVMDAARDTFGNENSGSTVLVQASFFYDADGGVRRQTESAGSQATSDYGEWIEGHPIAGVGSSYQIRVTHQTGTNRYSSGDGLNTWVALSSDRSWLFEHSVAAFGTDVSTYLVEVSVDSGATVLGSSTWTITFSNDGP